MSQPDYDFEPTCFIRSMELYITGLRFAEDNKLDLAYVVNGAWYLERNTITNWWIARTVNGSFVNSWAAEPEDFIIEQIGEYNGRRN